VMALFPSRTGDVWVTCASSGLFGFQAKIMRQLTVLRRRGLASALERQN
jgi:hypothetical protein